LVTTGVFLSARCCHTRNTYTLSISAVCVVVVVVVVVFVCMLACTDVCRCIDVLMYAFVHVIGVCIVLMYASV
jgi:amino acid permease